MMSKDQLGLGLVEQPELVTHKISKYLHQIKEGVLGEGESWGSKLTSERTVQLLPLVLCLSYYNDWHLTLKERCCNNRPEEFIKALSHLRWLEVCREDMVRLMEESDFTGLRRAKDAWPSDVMHAVRATEELEKWLYKNPAHKK